MNYKICSNGQPMVMDPIEVINMGQRIRAANNRMVSKKAIYSGLSDSGVKEEHLEMLDDWPCGWPMSRYKAITISDHRMWLCDRCGNVQGIEHLKMNYCPCCGAKIIIQEIPEHD